MLVPPLAALAAALALAVALYGGILRMDGPEAVVRELRSQAEAIAALTETRQFLHGFSYSGMESFIRDAVNTSAVLSHAAVFDEEALRFSYPESFAADAEKPPALPAESAARVAVLPDRPGTPIRVFAPILDDGVARGTVMTETTMSSVTSKRRQAIISIALCAVGGLIAAFAATARLARKIRRELRGMEPEEIANKYHSSIGMMEAMHEGVVAVDVHGMITMSNKAAKKLLGMKGRDINARHIRDVMPESRLLEVMASGRAEYNMEQQIHGRVLIANRLPIVEGDKIVGAMAVFQDKSQVVQLAEELTGARRMVDSLRAASHEFQNKTHVILGLLERGHVERAKEYILDIQRKKVISSQMVDVFRDPVVSGLVLAKTVSCTERGVVLDIAAGSGLEPIVDDDLNHSVVTIVGNLVDNAMESASANPGGDGRVALDIRESPESIFIEVADNGGGIEPKSVEKIFVRGYTTKGDGHGTGLFLVKQVAESAGGEVTVRSSGLETVFSVRLPK